MNNYFHKTNDLLIFFLKLGTLNSVQQLTIWFPADYCSVRTLRERERERERGLCPWRTNNFLYQNFALAPISIYSKLFNCLALYRWQINKIFPIIYVNALKMILI